MFDPTSLPWKDIVLLATGAFLTALLGGIAYLLKRRIEGTSFAARLDQHGKVLAIHKGLKSEGMTVPDLDRLVDELSIRRKATHGIEEQVAKELANHRTVGGPRPGETQAEMNILAGADLDASRAMLRRALVELEMHLTAPRDLLQTAQTAWEAFAKREAALRASLYKDGNVYPLMCTSELEGLTISRIAEVRAHTEWLKSL